MSNPPPADLEDLVAECVERIDRDGPVALEHLCAAHPGHAAALRAAIEPLLAYGLTGSRGGPDPSSPVLTTLPLPAQFGEFTLRRELGRGGMGVVYEAVQMSTGRRVAVKVLPAGRAVDPRQLARFQNEARAAATLDHPHIVPTLVVGQTGDHHWYAMRLCEGTSLRQLLRWLGGGEVDAATAAVGAALLGLPALPPTGALPVAWFRIAADLIRQAAEALDQAHGVGILHRDVKPGNLLVEASGHLWVTDFGLAHFHLEDADLTRSGEFVGTLAYSSPERVSGTGVADARSDVYSLGAALYELLVRRPPFAGSTPQLVRQVLDIEPPAPRGLDPRLPQALDTIVRTALQKEPQLRYPSARALAADLRAFADGRPIAARRRRPWQRLARWCAQNPLLAATGGTALGLAAVLAVVAWVTVRTTGERDRARAAEAEVTALSAQRTVAACIDAARARRITATAGRRLAVHALLREARDAIPTATAVPTERARLLADLRAEAIAVASHWDAAESPLLAANPGLAPLAFDRAHAHAVVANGTSLRVLDRQGTVRAELPFAGEPHTVQFASDDAWLTCVGHDGLRAWHWSTGRIWHLPGGTAPCLCSTRDRVIAIVEGELLGLDLTTGVTAPEVPGLSVPLADGMLTALQCTPDGRCLVVGHAGPPRLTVVTTAPTKTYRTVPLPDDAWQILVDDDGHHATVAGRFLDLLRVDLLQGTVVGRWPGHHAEVTGLARAPAGDLVASAGWDAQLRLWSRSGEPLLAIPTPWPVPELSFTADGRAVGWSPREAERLGARHWQLQPPSTLAVVALPDRAHTGKPELVQHPTLPLGALSTRDGITFLAAGSWTPCGSWPTDWPPRDLAFLADGALLVGFGDRRPPCILPVTPAADRLRIGPPRQLPPACARQDHAVHGERLFGSDGVTIAEFDLAGRWRRGFPAEVPSAADLQVAPDGRFGLITTFPAGDHAAVFDLASGAPVCTIPTGEPKTTGRFAPDGRRLVLARRDAFWVYDTATWQRCGVIPRPRLEATPGHCAWSPDSRLLVVPIGPARLLVVDATTLQPRFELDVPDGAPAGAPTFAADGSALLLPTIHRQLFVWRLPAIAAELHSLGLDCPELAAAPGPAIKPLPPLDLVR